MENNIDNLIKQICIRHICKNINDYVKKFEKALDIKLTLGSCKYEYEYTEKFVFPLNAHDKMKFIKDFVNNQSLFSVIDCNQCGHRLFFTFKFNPENAI